ncbi:MAG: hypothetical protein ACP5NF_07535 [Thermoanaerobaculum sp.]
MIWFLLVLLGAPRPAPAPVGIARIVVELPDPDHANLTLVARGAVPPLVPLVSQRLTLASVTIPLDGPPDLAVEGEGFQARIHLTLARLPEKLLELDPSSVPVRYEALDAKGKAVLVAESRLDLGDPAVLQVPVKRAYELFARLDRVNWQVTSQGLELAALLSFYNPLSFPITVRGLHYRLLAGDSLLVEDNHPGFRLKPKTRSDLLLQPTVPFSLLGAAASSILNSQQKPRLEGSIVIVTPAGDRSLPLGF